MPTDPAAHTHDHICQEHGGRWTHPGPRTPQCPPVCPMCAQTLVLRVRDDGLGLLAGILEVTMDGEVCG